MQCNEVMKMKGELRIKLFDEQGNLKQEQLVPNLVVTTGLNWLASRAVSNAGAMSHMALGTGNVAPALANTTLGAEIAASRVALASQTSANNVATFSAVFGAGVGTGAVTEAGIFDAAVAGTMLNRATFPVVNKGASDTMQITWTVSIS